MEDISDDTENAEHTGRPGQGNETDDTAVLEAKLSAWRERSKKLKHRLNIAKENYKSRARNEANARLGIPVTPPDPMHQLHKLCKIFGLEIVEAEKNRLSVLFYHWDNGKNIGKSFVALEKSGGTEEFAITGHNLPPGAVEWLDTVPCLVPQGFNSTEALRDIYASCFTRNDRSQQLCIFKEKFCEVKYMHNHNFTKINLYPSLLDFETEELISFLLELTYAHKSVHPNTVDISFDKKVPGDRKQDYQETLDEVKQQITPFRSIDLADAFFLAFRSKDDATNLTRTRPLPSL